MDRRYIDVPHTRAIVEALQALADYETNKLMIFMPPRHGKTYHASERFPAFFLGRMGGRAQLIIASASIGRAVASSRTVRNLVRERAWPYDVQLDAESTAVGEWRTKQGGIVKAAGVGVQILGYGADLLVIDDPIKSFAESMSALQRETAWNWYVQDAVTRLMPGKPRQLFMLQRFHEDDICGRILNGPTAKEWTVLKLPAVAEPDDPLGRPIGEHLWPEENGGPPLQLPGTSDITTRMFEAIYQQRPSALEGGMFLRSWMENRYETLPKWDKLVVSVDGAWKEGVTNSFSAFALWARVITAGRPSYYLVDVWRGHVLYPDLKAKLKLFYDKHNPQVVLIEDAASGMALVAELQRERLPIRPVPAKGSKEARAEAVTPLFEGGLVYLPKSAPWLDAWIEEHVTFPTGTYSDQVDTTSIALEYLKRGRSGPFWEVAKLPGEE
jgi:predicted phage terminase large subunit-like protein